jgi:hypothetical protein
MLKNIEISENFINFYSVFTNEIIAIQVIKELKKNEPNISVFFL